MPSWKCIAFGLALLVLNACASAGDYDAMLESWVGMSERDLVEKWGPPSRAYSLKNGNKVLYYSKSYEGRDIASYDEISGFSSFTLGKQCRTKFIVRGKKVINWNWSGNSCKTQDELTNNPPEEDEEER